jgi:hypothetical protein
MTSEPFVSSRFLIREKPIAYPYYDLCLQDSQGPVFDLNVEMDSYNGSVYLRTDHVIEMGRTLGMATKEEVASLRETIDDLRRQINTLPFAQEELKSGIDSLVTQFYSTINTLHSEPSLPVPDIQVAEPDNPEPEKAERKTIGPISL